MRERGLSVACRNGLFVMPKEAYDNSPMVVAICQLTVQYYNRTSDLKVMKSSCESVMRGTEGAIHQAFLNIIADLNKEIAELRTLAHLYRRYILDVEKGKPVNEPTNWVRG